MKINRIGVDIAKSVFHVHAIDRHGKVLWQAKLKRDKMYRRCTGYALSLSDNEPRKRITSVAWSANTVS